MVDEIRKLPAQQFSQTGMKLSDIKQKNELLFNYFTNAGYKEDAMIYSSDIESLTKLFDANEDGELSLKELKTMLGDDVSRSERRAVRKALNAVNTNDLSSTEELMPEMVDKHTTNYRNNKGDIVYTEATDEAGTTKTYPLNGSDIKIEKKERFENSVPGMVTTTEYLDGEPTMPSKETVDDNGDITTTDYNYNGIRLHTSEEVHGNEITFKKYRNGNDGFPEPTLIMEYKKGSQDQFRSYENQFDTDGNRTGIVIENTGSYIKDNGRVLKEEITLTPNGYEISSDQVKGIPDKFIQSKAVTVQKEDNSQEVQYFKNFDEKLHRIEKAKDGTEFVTIKIPQGWSVDKLAEEFGVKKEDILAANKAADGSARYLANSKGVQYFLADQSVRINNLTKISQELAEDRYLYGEDISAALPKRKLTTPNNHVHINSPSLRRNAPANGQDVRPADPANPARRTPARRPVKRVRRPITHRQYKYVNNGKVKHEAITNNIGKGKLNEKMRYSQKRGYGPGVIDSGNIENTMIYYYNNSQSGQTLVSALIHEKQLGTISDADVIKNLQYLRANIIYADSAYKTVSSNNRINPNLYAFIPQPGASEQQTHAEARIYEQVFGPGSSGIDLG